jgi:DNA-binding beta-propeller fold protein YncE
MRATLRILSVVASILVVGGTAPTVSVAADPYKVVKTAAVGGSGGFDYVFADADGRKLYVPRGNRVEVYDLDTLKSAGTITSTNGVHGAAVDAMSKHGFCSSNPVVMWDIEKLATLKTIPVEGRPDGILFDPATQHVLILSHSAPNATVIDTKDGSVVATIDLGGAPEQGASDGNGHLYISLENKSKVAVVDSKSNKVTGMYDLESKGGTPAGLALDVKNHVLFVCCRNPANAVIMNADDGKIITTLPIGNRVDAAAFDPNTNEAFVSTGDGKLTIIKETDPKTFEVEQTVETMPGAKTCTLDTKTHQVVLIASARPATPPETNPTTPPGRRGGRGGGTFTIIVVGKEGANR